MKLNPLLIFALCIFFAYKTNACINGETKVLKDGTWLYEDVEGGVPYGHNFTNSDAFEIGVIKLDSFYRRTNDIEYLSDKGVLLILLKKYDEAIKLYLEIESKEPNRYSTASNIGTAYELIGKNRDALIWINKAISIDPSSHLNSEWIHVKILEAKIFGENYITSKHLLNTDFGNKLMPYSSLSTSDIEILSQELFYQLNERISFIKPKDKIVAQLLFDLANMNLINESYYIAKSNYELAKDYGFTERLLEERLNVCQKFITENERKDSIQNINSTKVEQLTTSPKQGVKENSALKLIVAISICLLFLIGILIYFKRKTKK